MTDDKIESLVEKWIPTQKPSPRWKCARCDEPIYYSAADVVFLGAGGGACCSTGQMHEAIPE